MAGSNIVLIGMPGVGKSSSGVVLAKVLGMDFVDVDLLIQKRYGNTLQNLIDGSGVEAFLGMEGAVLQDISCTDTVISTGGSAVYSHEGMEHLGACGKRIYLQAGIDELAKRLPSFDGRGVAMRNPGIATLEDLLAERAPLYERYADAVVNTDGKSVAQVVEAVAALL